MIGIGVGIDYALFISTRYREALHEGVDPEAGGRALDRHERPGRALRRRHRRDLAARPVPDRRVVHPRPRGRRVARGAVRDGWPRSRCCPPCSASSGYTIDKFALPSARRKRTRRAAASGRGGAATCSRGRGPRRSSALLVLVVLALPFVSLRLGVADAGNDPTKFTTRRSYDLLSQGFGPGFNGPLLLASECRSPPSDVAAMTALGADDREGPRRRSRSVPTIASPNGKGVLLQVVPKGSPQDASTTALVHRLRDDVVPAGDPRIDARRARRWPDRARRRPRRHARGAACPACSSRSCSSASCC